MIRMTNLVKAYGEKIAVNGISLEIPQGQLVGYLGPNGAGKTTTIKMLTGMLRPTSGTAEVCGIDVVQDPLGVKGSIGYVPDSGAVFDALTGMEYLEMVGRLHSLNDAIIQSRALRFAEFFELTDDVLLGERLAGYSKGMRQKVVITAALLHNPQAVFFDEPLNGLDANMALMFKELIRNLARDGKTVLFCSHIMDVVERMCDRIIVIAEGKVVADGDLDQLRSLTGEDTLERIFGVLTDGGDAAEKAQAFSRRISFS